MYQIKFEDQTWLTKPSNTPYGNYYKDHANKYCKRNAMVFKYKIHAILIYLLVRGHKVVARNTTLKYELGKTYKTLDGGSFTVAEVKENTVCNSQGHHRYNRKDGGWDNGRTTGSNYTSDCLRYPPEEI
jgi:hypothetical protein